MVNIICAAIPLMGIILLPIYAIGRDIWDSCSPTGKIIFVAVIFGIGIIANVVGD